MRYFSLGNLSLIACLLNSPNNSLGQLPVLKQSIGVKPINFSNIKLGSNEYRLGGYHFGFEYERLIGKSRHWAVVAPITIAPVIDLNMITDYRRNGYQFYITPGVKYYFKDYNILAGFGISSNFIAGSGEFSYSTMHSSGNIKGMFTGMLTSGHYAVRIGKSNALHFELGIGMRYFKGTSSVKEIDIPVTFEKKSLSKVNGIINISLGFDFRLQ